MENENILLKQKIESLEKHVVELEEHLKKYTNSTRHLKYYENKNLIDTYNSFSQNFNTKGNMSLINESFRRNMMLTSLRKWIMSNIIHFDR